MDVKDLELLHEMTRISTFAEAVVIDVAEIHWLRPHTPFVVWHPLVVLPPDVASDVITVAQERLLQRKQFFAVCAECGLRHAKGHMHSATLCSGCAESSHSVVY